MRASNPTALKTARLLAPTLQLYSRRGDEVEAIEVIASEGDLVTEIRISSGWVDTSVDGQLCLLEIGEAQPLS